MSNERRICEIKQHINSIMSFRPLIIRITLCQRAGTGLNEIGKICVADINPNPASKNDEKFKDFLIKKYTVHYY